MSPTEFKEMQATGRVVESRLEGVTSVSVPRNPTAWNAAGEGSVFAEFDVPSGAVRNISPSNGWGKIYGPNSIPGKFYGVTEMPPATNITCPEE
jgi:hypothetical protein